MKALGKPTKLRDIAFINRAVWDRTVGGSCGPTGHGYNSGNQEGPYTTEESRVEIFRRVCLLRPGIQPDQPGASGLPALTVVPSGPGRATPPTTPCKRPRLHESWNWAVWWTQRWTPKYRILRLQSWRTFTLTTGPNTVLILPRMLTQQQISWADSNNYWRHERCLTWISPYGVRLDFALWGSRSSNLIHPQRIHRQGLPT